MCFQSIARRRLAIIVLFGLLLSFCDRGSTAWAEQLRGTLLMEIRTDVTGSVLYNFALRTPAGARRLSIPAEMLPIAHRVKGGRVLLTGRKNNARQAFLVRNIRALPQAAKLSLGDEQRQALRMALVVVTFPGIDASYLSSLGAYLRDPSLSSNSPPTFSSGFPTLDSVLWFSSLGELRIAAPRASEATPFVFGPVLIQRSSQENCENDYRTWGERALNAVASFGLKASDYDIISFIFPSRAELGCGVSAQGEYQGKYSWIFNFSLSTLTHEVGHNLGLEHAGRSEAGLVHADYADPTCPMGALNHSISLFNAPHIMHMGWARQFPTRFSEISSAGLHRLTLASLDDAYSHTNPGELQIVRIPLPGTAQALIVSFRTGLPSESNFWHSTISVHRDDGREEPTRLLASLATTQSLLLPELGLRITHLAHDAIRASLEIEIAPVASTTYSQAHCLLHDPCNRLGVNSALKAAFVTCDGAPNSSPSPLTFQTLPICSLGEHSGINPVTDEDSLSDPHADSDNDGYSNALDCDPKDPLTWRNHFYKDSDGDGQADSLLLSGEVRGPRVVVTATCYGHETPSGLLSMQTSASLDNCNFIFNSQLTDSDGDGVGDACDGDYRQASAVGTQLIKLGQALSLARQLLQQTPRHTPPWLAERIRMLSLILNDVATPLYTNDGTMVPEMSLGIRLGRLNKLLRGLDSLDTALLREVLQTLEQSLATPTGNP